MFADNPERERMLDQALDARALPVITTATQELRGGYGKTRRMSASARHSRGCI